MVETSEIQGNCIRLAAGNFSATILPALGGKIASLQFLGRELLQAPLAPLRARTQTMQFDESDASGWDECLPSVAPCSVATEDGMVSVPDHGDVWRVPWQVCEAGEQSCTIEGACFSLPLVLRRTTSVTETENGIRLRLDYSLSNVGLQPVPWSWAAHPLFAAEAGDRIVLPASIRSLRLEGSGGERLGKPGASVAWPLAQLANGGTTDLSIVQSPETGIGDKLFAGSLGEDENWCALERQSVGARIRVSFEPAATPYLGLWICYGGWPARPGSKQMCVALEPSTAPVDSLARTGEWSREIDSGETFSWPMIVDFEEISRS